MDGLALHMPVWDQTQGDGACSQISHEVADSAGTRARRAHLDHDNVADRRDLKRHAPA